MSWELTMGDFCIVTFAVDPDRVAALVPHGFEPESFTFDDGTERAFVSAVAFRAKSLLAGGVRFPLGFVQVNYRAYVRRHGERCVWFFGATVSSPIVKLPRVMLGLPWKHAESSLHASWESGRCVEYALRAKGDWGDAEFECVGSGAAIGRLDGFQSPEETLEVLTSPFSGFCLRPNGSLLELRVSHEPLEPQVGTVRTARFAAFEELNLCARGAAPHSVLLQEATTFDVLPVEFLGNALHDRS